MSEGQKIFDWERSLDTVIAKNNDHAFAVLLDGKTSDEALASCQKLYQAYVDEHDDVCALRQVEYLLTMQRDRFREAPNADARSVRYGTAEAALTRWRKLPRSKEGRPGCPSTPALLRTKAYAARLAMSVWAARETSVVSATTVFLGLLSLPSFGLDEAKVLVDAIKVATETVPHERLCRHTILLIEKMSSAERGSLSARPHIFLQPMLVSLARRMVVEWDREMPRLQNFAVALNVLNTLNETTDVSARRVLADRVVALMAKND
jgi:hypothetical protein